MYLAMACLPSTEVLREYNSLPTQTINGTMSKQGGTKQLKLPNK